jgi:hypothetical protein
VWSVASNGEKEMGQREFFTAMRLIALAQAGQTISNDTLSATYGMNVPFPKFQGVQIAKPSPVPTSPNSGGNTWVVSPEALGKYEQLWATLSKNEAGFLEGKDAATFFAKSGQSREILRSVWQMSDVTNDGMMDLFGERFLLLLSVNTQRIGSAKPNQCFVLKDGS